MLAQHRAWEVAYISEKLAAPVSVSTIPIEECESGASLWEIEWPTALQAKDKVAGRIFLTFVAGQKIVVIAMWVPLGQSPAERVAYLKSVALDLQVYPFHMDHAQMRRWLEENGFERSTGESDPDPAPR